MKSFSHQIGAVLLLLSLLAAAGCASKTTATPEPAEPVAAAGVVND